MDYTISVQNESQSVYTPYIIKPGNGNDYVTYADFIKLGNITDFGYKEGYTSFSTWQGFITSVHAHLQDLYSRCNGEIIPDTISVTGVTISSSATSINIGETIQLTANVSPSNATNKAVSWSSNNTSVATVNSSGLVTGISNGTATITVTTVDGNKTASKSFTVQQAPPSQSYYWYIGVDNPSSISNIQTSNTVPGWHEIGSSLSGFVLNTDANVIDLGTASRVIYNVIIPEELHIYAADGTTNVESIYFNSITSHIQGYKAFKVIPSEYYPEGEWEVCGIVIK